MDFQTPNEDAHVVDMDAVGEAEFEIWPKGWKNFVVAQHDYELSQNSGAPMWVLVLEVESGPSGLTGEEDPQAGKTVKTYLSFSEKALPYTKKTINQVWPGLLEDEQWKTNGKFDIKKVGDAGLFVGNRVSGLIKHSKYEGQTRHNVAQLKRNDENSFLSA